MRQDGFVAWKFPAKIQTYFNIQIDLDPYMRDYFMLVKTPANDESINLNATEIMDIQENFFYPGVEFTNYKWICLKSYPLTRYLFPIFVSHAGALFGDNYLTDPSYTHISSTRIIGTVSDQFEICFNPTIFIPYTDALFNSQRFCLLNSKGRAINFDPESSHVWFELFFY